VNLITPWIDAEVFLVHSQHSLEGLAKQDESHSAHSTKPRFEPDTCRIRRKSLGQYTV
jgi:hypothetical protein